MLTRTAIPPWYCPIHILAADFSLVSLRAWDLKSGDQVVLHVCRRGAGAGPEKIGGVAEVFRRMARLDIPGVAPLTEAGTYDGCPFASRKFIPGDSLHERLLHRPALTQSEASRIYQAISAALTGLAAHSLGHGSLTSQNVILAATGDVLVTDAMIRFAATRFHLAGSRCRLDLPPSMDLDRSALAHVQAELALASMRWPLVLEEPASEEVHLTHLFQLVWRPAAVIGLCASLGTVSGLATPEPPMAAHIPAPLPAALQVQPTPPDAATVGLRHQAQIRGLEAATVPEIADFLDLSDRQREDVERILQTCRDQVATLVETAAETDGHVPQRLMAAVRDRAEARFLAILNSAQKARWHSLRQLPVSQAPTEDRDAL